MKPDFQIIQGDCRTELAKLPEKSIHCVVTSPPYHGLRKYQGVEPSVWGMLPDEWCSPIHDPQPRREHEWRDDGCCAYNCGAWRGLLGLEPTIDQYVRNIVECFRAVKRVLRDDGTLWLNLGDSYSQGKMGRDDYGDTTSTLNNAKQGSGKTGVKHSTPTQQRKAPGLPPKNLIGQPWRVAFALQADGWYLRSALPWVKRCLSGGTRVYARTQKGDMPTTLKDLVRLDPATVQLWTGRKWTRVVGFHETPRPDAPIELTLRTGERIGCTADHRWPTERGLQRSDELVVSDVLQSCRLPEPSVRAPIRHLPDDLIGWFVGLYIAEGHRSERTIHISGHTKESARRTKLRELCAAYDASFSVTTAIGYAQRCDLAGPTLSGILNTYVSGEGSRLKHLTSRAWRRSNAFLASVLDGYLGGDGHWDGKRWRLGFCSNDALAADLRTICARLGYSCRLRRKIHKCGEKKHPGWGGEIRLDTTRNFHNSGAFQRQPNHEVVKIGRSNARKFWDVEVADSPHLFALASGTLTHNSAMPEAVTDRPTSALEYVFLLTKSPRYFWDAEAVRVKHSQPERGHGEHEKNLWSVGGTRPGTKEFVRQYNPGGRNFRNTDLFFESLKPPYGMIFAGDEPVGLDVTPAGLAEKHYASFPRKLIRPLILASTSERGCCPECCTPWVRCVEKSGGLTGQSWHSHEHDTDQGNRPGFEDHRRAMADAYEKGGYKVKTLGWRPGCECKVHWDDPSGGAPSQDPDTGEWEIQGQYDHTPVPCTVLDPFVGSGTAGIVATQQGRRFVGIDASAEYCAIARRRIADPEPEPEPVDAAGQMTFEELASETF